jgi:hypothetical protein
MLGLWGLAALACILCLAAPPPAVLHGQRGEQVLDLIRVAATASLAVTLLFGPGVLWRAASGRRVGLAFLPLPGLALLALTGGIAWALADSVEPRLVFFLVFGPVLGLLLGGLLGTGPEDVLDPEERKALLIVGCALGLAIARALWSAGPEGELYGGTIARTLEVGDRSDPRISYNVVQLVAHGTAPFSSLGNHYFNPYDFSSRGPLAGLASSPVVFLGGGKPPVALPTEGWQPFDPQGYMAYRVAMMTFASTAFVALWDLTRRLGGTQAARVALILAATTPFLAHEIWFTWPKMLAATFVLLAGIRVLARRPLSAGALVGIGYLVHPSALLGLSALALIALWPISGAEWRRPQLKQAALLLLGAAVGVLAWRLLNGANYTQGEFFEYLTSAGSNSSPNPIEWLAQRGESVANTFVPLVLPLAFPHDPSINVYGGISPFSIHFFFQYWNNLAFGVAIVFFPLLLLSLWRAFRRWPWPVFAVVVAPAVAFAIYWGSFHSGLLREGLQAWVLALFAVVAVQQQRAGFPWFRSRAVKTILTLRVLEVLLVAVGPTLATTQVLVGPVFSVSDVAAVAAMVGFSALLGVLVWSTSPVPSRSDTTTKPTRLAVATRAASTE